MTYFVTLPNGWIRQCLHVCVTAIALAAIGSPRLWSQDATGASESPRPDAWFRYFSLGFSVRGITQGMFADGKSTPNRSDTTTNTTQTFSTTSGSGNWTLGPALEVPLPWKLSLLSGLYFQHVRYTKVITTYKGIDDLSSGALKSTVTERTKASFWDVPLLLRYRNLGRRAFLSKAFVEGGAEIRIASGFRTGTETVYADSSTEYAEVPVTPNARRAFGIVAGGGFRFVDDARIKVIPEVRYTNWNRRVFDSDSTRSRTGQLEIEFSVLF